MHVYAIITYDFTALWWRLNEKKQRRKKCNSTPLDIVFVVCSIQEKKVSFFVVFSVQTHHHIYNSFVSSYFSEAKIKLIIIRIWTSSLLTPSDPHLQEELESQEEKKTKFVLKVKVISQVLKVLGKKVLQNRDKNEEITLFVIWFRQLQR